MTKFTIGDRVRIRSWDDMAKQYGTEVSDGVSDYVKVAAHFTRPMQELCGCTATIDGIIDEGIFDRYSLTDWELPEGKEDADTDFIFSEGMLELTEAGAPIRVKQTRKKKKSKGLVAMLLEASVESHEEEGIRKEAEGKLRAMLEMVMRDLEEEHAKELGKARDKRGTDALLAPPKVPCADPKPFDWEAFANGHISVHCSSKEDCRLFCLLAHEHGMSWAWGESPFTIPWARYEGQTSISAGKKPHVPGKEMWVSTAKQDADDGFTVVDVEDFIFEKPTLAPPTTFDWESVLKGMVAVSCPSEKEAIQFLRGCHELGLTWKDNSPTIARNMWFCFREKSAYICNRNSVSVGTDQAFTANGIPIVPFDPEQELPDRKTHTTPLK